MRNSGYFKKKCGCNYKRNRCYKKSFRTRKEQYFRKNSNETAKFKLSFKKMNGGNVIGKN